MRYAINCIGVGDTETPLSICNFVRETTQGMCILIKVIVKKNYD